MNGSSSSGLAAVQSLQAAIHGRNLSASGAKTSAYMQEPFAREGYLALYEIFGDSTAGWLQSHTLLTLKPDLIASRRIGQALRFLEDNQFAVRWHTSVQLSRLAIETIWRYHWNVATADRHALAKQVYCHTPSLLLLLEDRSVPKRVPASVRFGPLKGSPIPERQEDFQIRKMIATPNRMMSMVHAPDEPLDVIRELAIILEPSELTSACLDWAQTSARPSLTEEIGQIYAGTEASPLDYRSAMKRLEHMSGSEGLDQIRRSLHRYERTAAEQELLSTDLWRETSGLIQRYAPGLSTWDRLTIWAQAVVHELPGTACLIEDVDITHWEKGDGQMIDL